MSRRSISRFVQTSLILVLALALPLSLFAAAKDDSSASGNGDPKVKIHKLVHFDLSPPLRDIPPAPRQAGVKRIHPIKMLPHKIAPGEIDGAAQMSAAPSINSPAVSTQFNGIGSNNGFTVASAPPDTNGDVSSTQYVQTVNTDFAVFNKSTGAYTLTPRAINTIWSGFGGLCQTDNDGDPTVTWDQLANRWIITQFAVSGTTTAYLQCVAVSQTSDALGSWYRFSYSFGNQFPDYPKLGMMVDASNPNGGAYYQTFNLFNSAGTAFLGGDICAYNRAALIAGTTNSIICYNAGTAYGGLLAADLDGATLAPSGSPEFVVGLDGATTSTTLVYFTVTPNFSNSTMAHTGPTTLTVASYTQACNGGTCVPQSGVTQTLDSLADRMMNRLQYRNFAGSIKMVASHSVTVSGAAAVRWYQFNVSGSSISVNQQQSFAPNTTYRWMPSIAMDGSQDIAVGYSTSSSSLHPGIAYTGRIPTDPANTMQAETVAFTGAGSQTGSNLSRWGDYSNMSIDPADDCTFWYTTEYIPSNGAFNWATRIVSFKFPTCGGGPADTTPPTTSLTAPAAGTYSGTITVSANANDNVGVTNVEFYAGATLIGSDPSSPYSINWDTTTVANGSYSLTSKAYDAAGNSASSTGVSVTVSNVAGPPALTAAYDATLKAPLCGNGGKSCDTGASLINGRGTMTNGNETNRPNTINNSCTDGNSGTYHSDESIDRMVVATNDGTAFAGAKTVTVSATVWCYTSSPSSDTIDLYYTSNAASPTWTLIASKTCTAGGAQTLTATYTLPSTGTQHAVRGNYRYQGAAGSCTTGGYDDHDDLIFGVAQAADTTAPTTSITAPANGATVAGSIAVNASASDNVGVTKVEFYVDSVLKNTDTTSPYGFTLDTTTYANGSHTIFSKAYDAANNVGTSSTITVTVNNVAGPPDNTATYSATFKAPSCPSGGKSCDTGASLINGRGTMSGGVESNQPNTINSSCADGSSGTYHSDESIDRMKVATNDGTALAATKLVTITFTTYCYSSADKLDVYYTSNATTPSWTLIGTQTCTAAGVKTFTAGYTLPAGANQAVRGTFRYNGSASACGTNSGYDDHDDLVFGVN